MFRCDLLVVEICRTRKVFNFILSKRRDCMKRRENRCYVVQLNERREESVLENKIYPRAYFSIYSSTARKLMPNDLG